MSLLVREINRTVDLAGPVLAPETLWLVYGDKRAHQLRIRVVRHGAPVSLQGIEVKGYVLKPDGVTVPLVGVVETDGAGDIAVTTLDDSCYGVPGHATVSMELTLGETRTTIIVFSAEIIRTTSDVTLDGGLIPSVAEVGEMIKNAFTDERIAAALQAYLDAHPFGGDVTFDGTVTAKKVIGAVYM